MPRTACISLSKTGCRSRSSASLRFARRVAGGTPHRRGGAGACDATLWLGQPARAARRIDGLQAGARRGSGVMEAVIAQPAPVEHQPASGWQRSLQYLGVAWAGLLLLFWRDAADMAAIWWNSSTFNHCLLILPILVWLVMQRKELLAELKPETVDACGALWSGRGGRMVARRCCWIGGGATAGADHDAAGGISDFARAECHAWPAVSVVLHVLPLADWRGSSACVCRY